MAGFIVERYWPGVTAADVLAAAAALHDATSSSAAGDGGATRYLGSILLAGDEVVLFRFEASDSGLVEAASARAGVRCDRVVPAEFLD